MTKTLILYIIEFFIFAFLGWIIDSIYCSLTSKKLVWSGYFKFLPLCPIYGFGGIVIINLFVLFNGQAPLLVISKSTLAVIALEYFGGFFAEHLLEEKLWDYSNEAFNLGGYVSLKYAFFWLFLISLLYFLIGEELIVWLDFLASKIVIDSRFGATLILIFFFLVFKITIKNKDLRLKKYVKEKHSSR